MLVQLAAQFLFLVTLKFFSLITVFIVLIIILKVLNKNLKNINQEIYVA